MPTEKSHAAQHDTAGSVLDLRAAHLDFAIVKAQPSTINTPEDIARHGLYSAILRDGRVRIYAKAEQGRTAGVWIEMREMTVESAKRLRDVLDDFLTDRAAVRSLPASWRDL